MRVSTLAAATAALLLTVAVTVSSSQCPQQNWTMRGDSCYKWFSNHQYWFDAEQVCRSHEAHLVSIGSEHENRLVARLSQCRDAWIGRFGTDLNRLTHPSSYAWTDGSSGAVSFERHNFTQLDTVHKPLIRIGAHGEWWLNSLYHERHPFVCEQRANMSTTARCPNGWSLFQNECYLMPEFHSNFMEANFYCQRASSQLVSVLTESELRHLNKFIFGIDSCHNGIDKVWLGLIKLNPCFPDSRGRELCYQWTDFSGKHLGFPAWQTGHPNMEDWTVNCVTLSGDRLHSDRCDNRHRFVCKSAAANDTDGGAGSVDGVVAAFDFRKGLHNLVDARTFIVRDEFGVPRTKEDGACFTSDRSSLITFKPFYKIGQTVSYKESLLSQPEWTLFVRSSAFPNDADFVSIGLRGSDNYVDWAFLGYRFFYPESKNIYTESSEYENATSLHVNSHRFFNTSCSGSWCNLAISMKNHRAMLYVNERFAEAEYSSKNLSTRWPQKFDMFLGHAVGGTHLRHCISCFGIAHRQLSGQELQEALSAYCA